MARRYKRQAQKAAEQEHGREAPNHVASSVCPVSPILIHVYRIHSRFIIKSMFNSSKDVNASQSTFSTVKHDQYNVYHVYHYHIAPPNVSILMTSLVIIEPLLQVYWLLFLAVTVVSWLIIFYLLYYIHWQK